MSFRPRRFSGVIFGAGAVGVLVLAAIGLTYRTIQLPLSMASFLLWLLVIGLVTLALILAFWTFCCWALEYRLQPGLLVIHWGPTATNIPLDHIQAIKSGEGLAVNTKMLGISWPGHYVGRANLTDVGDTLLYSSSLRPSELLLLATPDKAYAISPSDTASFTRELEARRQEAASMPAHYGVALTGLASLSFWRDRRLHWLVAGGLLLSVSLFGFVLYSYPALPEILPLHFAVFGQVDLVGPRAELVVSLLLALGILLGNIALGLWLHARERLIAYLCISSGLLVQVLVWGAILRIVFRALRA